MAYYHGIKTAEIPTKLVPSAEIDSGLIFCVGTSPVHMATNPAPANKPVLCYELSEYVEQFGYSGDFEKFTNDEMAASQFQLFSVSPIVFVNVLDKDKHYNKVEVEVGGLIENPVTLSADIFLETLQVKSAAGEVLIELVQDTDYTATVDVTEDGDVTTIDIKVDAVLPSDDLKITYTSGGESVTVDKNVEDLPFALPVNATLTSIKAVTKPVNVLQVNEDFTAAYNSDGEVVINVLKSDKIFNDTVQISYHESAPEKVTAEDIIGGYDAVTGEYKGLELVEQVFPRFRLVPGILVSPGFSQDVTVAAVMKAKCVDINSVFQAVAVVDIPTDTVRTYTAVAEYKNLKNLIDKSLITCWPKVSLGGKQYHLSTQLASLMNYTDAELGDGIPYISPSNKNLQMDSSVLADGTEIPLSLDKANYLNSQGIVTALNFSGGWKAWGNRTSLYGSDTDPKDTFIPVKRTFLWLRNTLILTYWARVDAPMNKRFIESFIDSINLWLNGLHAKGVILGGKVEFRQKDNPTTDLIAGKVVFHVDFTPPVPAEHIQFNVEFNPDYFATLFE